MQSPHVLASLSLIAALAAAPAARAQDEPDAGNAPPEPAVADDSPRASMARFIDLCRAGDYDGAAEYLALPAVTTGPDAGRGAELARRLSAVLDRHVSVDVSKLSPLSGGLRDDQLPSNTEQIGVVPAGADTTEPVRLVKRDERWVFAPSTVKRVDAWYSNLEQRWLMEHLPEQLLRPGPRGLLYWQWLAMPLLIVLAWLIGHLVSRLALALGSRLVARTETRWDNLVLEALAAPLTAGFALAVTYALLPWLALYRPAELFVHAVMRAAFLVLVFWAASRLVDVARQVVAASPWAHHHAASRSLVPLGARVAKVALWVVALVALLSEFGYPVASLIAGLGVGGLAVALAAQKTVENLFGAFSIGADQPFREGDFVKIEDFTGTVEAIGLRSTRIRTLDRTIISLPNGKLADMRLESFAARDRLRLALNVGLVYGTTAAQVREVLAGFERVLHAQPKLWTESVTVKLVGLGASSLDIEVMAWFATSDGVEFQTIRQDVLLEFLAVVEAAGTALAYPTQTVQLQRAPRQPVAGREPPEAPWSGP